jgi:hypothetical protein
VGGHSRPHTRWLARKCKRHFEFIAGLPTNKYALARLSGAAFSERPSLAYLALASDINMSAVPLIPVASMIFPEMVCSRAVIEMKSSFRMVSSQCCHLLNFRHGNWKRQEQIKFCALILSGADSAQVWRSRKEVAGKAFARYFCHVTPG